MRPQIDATKYSSMAAKFTLIIQYKQVYSINFLQKTIHTKQFAKNHYKQ
ncbi:hypothetical protein PULV_a0638 [Pseudoalteromonas ulvae UL12]|nr:hypothetical protein [Pseudoalteromonas ulvae UL12]